MISFAEVRQSALAKDPWALCEALQIDKPCKRQPRGLSVLCPSHQERNASCSVIVRGDGTVSANCFTCGFKGDAITLASVVWGCSRVDAKNRLAGLAGLSTADTVPQSATRRKEEYVPVNLRSPIFHEVASSLLGMCPLRRQRDVCTYLEGRNIFADAEAFGCLAALPSWARQRDIVAALRATYGDGLDGTGLLNGNTFAWPEHRLIIPWRTGDGRITSLQRRVIAGNPDQKYVFPKDHGATRPFGIEHLQEAFSFFSLGGVQADLIITEGPLDALARRKIARWQDHAAAVIAVPSSSILFDPYLWPDLVKDRKVIISLDNDENGAGDRGAERLANWCVGARQIVREKPVKFKDIGEVLKGAA